MSTKQQPTSSPRTLRDVSPEFAETSDMLRDLSRREDELLAKIGPLSERLSSAGAFNGPQASTPKHVRQPPKPIAASDGAAAILGALTPPPRVAEEWAMIDNFSHGRVAIAAASGWHVNCVNQSNYHLQIPEE